MIQDPPKKLFNQPLSPSNSIQKNQNDSPGCTSPYGATSPNDKNRVGLNFPDYGENETDQKMTFDDNFTSPSLVLSRDHEIRLGKVLEDFEQGENVYMDKGVQDGRAEEDIRDDNGSGVKVRPLNSIVNVVSAADLSKNCGTEK